jgi:hypothetical protein
MNNEEPQDWRRLAEERGQSLAEAEKTARAWMKTAQLAEEWAAQLDRVRQWLQEQLLAQGRELQEAQQRSRQVHGELVALREQCAAANQALTQKNEYLSRLERSRGLRLVRWVRYRLLPPQTLRGRLVAKSVRVTLRWLRRSA